MLLQAVAACSAVMPISMILADEIFNRSTASENVGGCVILLLFLCIQLDVGGRWRRFLGVGVGRGHRCRSWGRILPCAGLGRGLHRRRS